MTAHVLDTLLLAFLGKMFLLSSFKNPFPIHTRLTSKSVLCSQLKITDVLDRKLYHAFIDPIGFYCVDSKL